MSLHSHGSLLFDMHINDACEGSLTPVKHTSRDFIICPFMLPTLNTDTHDIGKQWETIILNYSDLTCHMFILFFGITEIYQILGLREGTEF